jgi:hypothetical protein
MWDGKTGVDSSAPKMKSVGFSKIPVHFYHITRCHIPEQLAFFKFFLTQHAAPDVTSTYCEADHTTHTTVIFHCILHNVDGFGGLVVSMLASGSQAHGFKSGRSRWIFLV